MKSAETIDQAKTHASTLGLIGGLGTWPASDLQAGRSLSAVGYHHRRPASRAGPASWCDETPEMNNDRHDAPARLYRLRGKVDRKERRFLLAPGESRIGSADVNDLLLPVPGVSRQHARLLQVAERLTLEDLASRNGTFVNGRRIDRAEVRLGDALRFGPVELQLDDLDAGDAELAMILTVPDATDPSPFPADMSTIGVTESLSEPDGVPPLPELDFPAGYVPGRSPAMNDLYRSLAALLATDLPVLIEGETGVGKELVARTLHLSSCRRSRPFVAVNCAAIPADPLEAEMFGIGDGVATGGRKRHGRFRAAAGGTLFLDELGEMPLELQAKLLRALQEKEIQPVGGVAIPVDAWILAASNVDLLEKANAGRFRRDLYYRVAGSVLRVPPLRARVDDLPVLIESFLRRFAADSGKVVHGVTAKALSVLERHSWPGNVRELEHEVRRLAHLCADGQAIDSTMLAERLLHPVAPRARHLAGAGGPAAAEGSLRLEDHVQEAERRAILQAFESAGGSQRQTARLLGISRNTLIRKIRRLGIETRHGRSP